MAPQTVFNDPHYYLSCFNHQTELIWLDEWLNPLKKHGVEIGVKILHYGTVSGKIIPIEGIILGAKEAGELKGVHTIAIPSSANAGLATIHAARRHGYKSFVFIPSDIAPGKLEQYRLLSDPDGFRLVGQGDPLELAREMGSRPGYYYLAQYHDERNPEAHERFTGAQLIDDTEGNLDFAFVAGGTSGTMGGIQRACRKKGVPAKVVLVLVADGQAIPGMRTETRISHVGLPWRNADRIAKVARKWAFFASLRLTQGFVHGGPSTGAALWAALTFFGQALGEKRLEEYRNPRTGKIRVVVPSIDSLESYWDKVSSELDKEEIPPAPMPLPPI